MEDEREYQTTDQGFAAFLATRYMFLGSIDTGEKIGKGKYGTKKAFQFLVPDSEDMDQLKLDYELGSDTTLVRAVVMFNKLRLVRQSCQKPFNPERVGA